MDLKERLAAVAKYSNLSTRALAIKCGMSQPTLDKQLRGARSVSIDTVIAMCSAFPELSREWILMGEGEMLKTEVPDPNGDRVMKLIDTITTLQETISLKNETIALLKSQLNTK